MQAQENMRASTIHSGLLLSIQAALPRQHGDAGAAEPMRRLWTTAFFKEPVAGPVWLGLTNIAGDRQADL